MGGRALKPTATRWTARLSGHWWAALLFVPAALLLGAHALVPHDEFIHRGDDAFYYFGIAANFPETGGWTFDGVVPTNGVQPLWAAILTALAQVLHWIGVDSANGFARAAVALTGLVHLAANVLLYLLLKRTVSRGAGLAAAGAFLFSLPLVWPHVWGMENSLYALTLLAAVTYYELAFRPGPTMRGATLLGLLLGLMALARLNAALFVPVLLGWHLLRGPGSVRDRLPHAAVAAAVAAALVLPYAAVNIATTGHLAPISGEAKALKRAELMREQGVSSVLSPGYAGAVVERAATPLRRFVQSRAADGLWIVGGRVAFAGGAFVSAAALVLGMLVLLLAPLAVGPPRRWLAVLGGRLSALGRFGYLAVFAAGNVIVSAMLYPSEVSYAMTSWWLVETEIVVVATVATIAATSVSYVLRSLAPRAVVRLAVPLALATLVAIGTFQAASFFWDGENDTRDWHSSWNDDSYAAARWLGGNVPRDALVGSWNAGVLGYYAPQRVVNLDGLVNNADLLPHLERGNVSDYVLERGIRYLSDIDTLTEDYIGEELELSLVYSRRSELLGRDYRIYRVDGPAAEASG